MLDFLGLGNIGAILAGIGAVIAAVWSIFAAGRRSERKSQEIDDLEHGRDIRRRTDEAARRHKADMAQLPDDDDARRAALADRLRKLRRRGD